MTCLGCIPACEVGVVTMSTQSSCDSRVENAAWRVLGTWCTLHKYQFSSSSPQKCLQGIPVEYQAKTQLYSGRSVIQLLSHSSLYEPELQLS